MIKFLLALIAVCTLAHAQPSSKALNDSLRSIGSEESYEDINALNEIRDKYAASYKSHMKRYTVTKEEHATIAKKFEEANIPLFFSLIPYCESNFRSDVRGNGTAGRAGRRQPPRRGGRPRRGNRRCRRRPSCP